MAGNNAEIVYRFYEHVARGDLAGASGLYDEDLVWVEPPFPGHPGGSYRGKANVFERVLLPFVSTWTDLRVEPERLVDGGASVVVLGRYRGRHCRTGRPFEARFAHTWTLAGGRATQFEMLADTVQFFLTVRPDLLDEFPAEERTADRR